MGSSKGQEVDDASADSGVDFTIDERVIEDFCKSDVIPGSFYQSAMESYFHEENIFFRALSDESESEVDGVLDAGTIDELVKRPTIVRVMKDSLSLEYWKYA